MTNRRSFLAAAPASLLGLPQFANRAFAQASSGDAGYDNEIVSFWASHMAVPPDQLGGDPVVMRGAAPPSFEREPYLFYYDEKAKSLVPATDVKPTLKTGDAQLNMSVARYRLNSDDQAVFSRYASGGMYLDVQQQQSSGQHFMDMASSVFSAIFPQVIGKSKSTKSGGIGGIFGSSSSTSSTAGSTPSLQASETQSLGLPNGSGKASVVAFAKDKTKTAFGMFVSAISTVNNAIQPAYLPLLSLPTIAAPALAAMRALVGNLQAHGSNQQWLLQGPPQDVAATEDAASNLKKGAKFNSGYMIAVPKGHLGKFKGLTDNVQVVDGFLVPANVGPMDVYDWIQANPPGGSYLTLSTSVKATKLNNCSISSLLKG